MSVHLLCWDTGDVYIALPDFWDRSESLRNSFRVDTSSSDVRSCTLFSMKLVVPSATWELPRTTIAYVGCLALREDRVKCCTLLIVQ